MDFRVFANAGPLWLALESLLESLPFWARWVLLVGLAVLVIAAPLAVVFALYKRRK